MEVPFRGWGGGNHWPVSVNRWRMLIEVKKSGCAQSWLMHYNRYSNLYLLGHHSVGKRKWVLILVIQTPTPHYLNHSDSYGTSQRWYSLHIWKEDEISFTLSLDKSWNPAPRQQTGLYTRLKLNSTFYIYSHSSHILTWSDLWIREHMCYQNSVIKCSGTFGFVTIGERTHAVFPMV
jgi:hypothetical protein